MYINLVNLFDSGGELIDTPYPRFEITSTNLSTVQRVRHIHFIHSNPSFKLYDAARHKA